MASASRCVVEQRGRAAARKASKPQPHRWMRDAYAGSDFSGGHAIERQQHDAASPDNPLRRRGGADPMLELGTFMRSLEDAETVCCHGEAQQDNFVKCPESR